MNMKPGDYVQVKAFGNRQLVRRLVSIQKRVALICTDREYQSAQSENRKPICIGFPLSDISKYEPKRKT
jgi:hypothetical protein